MTLCFAEKGNAQTRLSLNDTLMITVLEKDWLYLMA